MLVETGFVASAVEDVGLAAKAGHLGLGFCHLLGELLDLRSQLGACILALEHGAQGEIVAVELGQLVGEDGGELRVLGPEIDHDAARILDLVYAQRVVVGVENALFLALAGTWPHQADEAQELAEHTALDERAVEFRLGRQMELGRQLDGEVARLQCPDVGGDRLLVHAHGHHLRRARVAAWLERVAETLRDDLDLRLRGVLGCQQGQDHEACQTYHPRGDQQLAEHAFDGGPQQGEVDVVG